MRKILLGERQTLAAAHTTDVIVMLNPLLVVFVTTGRVDVLDANIDPEKQTKINNGSISL